MLGVQLVPVCIVRVFYSRESMSPCAVFRNAASVLIILAACAPFCPAQKPAGNETTNGEELKFVVYLSRHGVRSPTGKPAQYNPYSAAPWPEWSVPPGHLTDHGYKLMMLFGSYDRARLAAAGLLAPAGCADVGQVTILADSDQRTRETGKAIAQGMFPGCAVDVHALPENTDDPLFHPPLPDGPIRELALAAVAGRIGGDPSNLTDAYRPQLTALDQILAGCGQGTAGGRKSLFDIPSTLTSGKGDHPIDLKGPLSVASTLSENLLLEYTDGMKSPELAWGCMDESALRSIMQLHASAEDFVQRTPVIARMYASNLLDQIRKAMEQSATAKPVAGAAGKPDDRVLFLVGHDTNIATVAGALGLTWIIDGRRDDTPPGGALVFALWRSRANGKFFVRVTYTAQTLEQMRAMQTLSLIRPPPDVSVFVPGCSGPDGSCEWSDFQSVIQGLFQSR
jgi:4-phytase/acid phosphatase